MRLFSKPWRKSAAIAAGVASAALLTAQVLPGTAERTTPGNDDDAADAAAELSAPTSPRLEDPERDPPDLVEPGTPGANEPPVRSDEGPGVRDSATEMSPDAASATSTETTGQAPRGRSQATRVTPEERATMERLDELSAQLEWQVAQNAELSERLTQAEAVQQEAAEARAAAVQSREERLELTRTLRQGLSELGETLSLGEAGASSRLASMLTSLETLRQEAEAAQAPQEMRHNDNAYQFLAVATDAIARDDLAQAARALFAADAELAGASAAAEAAAPPPP